MTLEKAIELVRNGEVTFRQHGLAVDFISLLESFRESKVEQPKPAEVIPEEVAKESMDWYLERNRKLSEIIIRYLWFCKRLRTCIAPTEDLFTDFQIDTDKIAEVWKQMPSTGEIEPEILQTLKELARQERQ